MRLQFGPHKGRTAETLMLRVPDYAWWTLRHSAKSRLAQAFARLTTLFDAKPFSVPCQSCGQDATHAEAYAGATALHLFCDECRLYEAGPPPLGFASDLRTLEQVIAHAEMTAHRRRRRDVRAIVRDFARAKGAPRRITEAAADAFFSEVR